MNPTAKGTESEVASPREDDVTVESNTLVGEIDGGWTVAMYLLSCERGSFAWQRNTFLAQRLTELAEIATDPPALARELGSGLVRTRKVPLGVDLRELPGASFSAQSARS